MPKSSDFSEKFKNIITETVFNDMTFLVANQLKAEIEARVFSRGVLTSGKKTGGYLSKEYAKKRIEAGKLNTFKNFKFTGDNTSDAFKLLKNENGIAEVGFNNDDTAQKMVWQDEQMRRLRGVGGETNVIFSASDKEIEKATRKATKKIISIVEKKIKDI